MNFQLINGSLVTVSIRLDPQTEQRLDNLATQTGRAKSYYLRELSEKGLDDLEDFYLADATMERVRKGQESVLDSAEVRWSLGLGNEVHRNLSATTEKAL